MKRGWVSFKTWNLNMFSLIALGVAAAMIFSLIALFSEYSSSRIGSRRKFHSI
jgi:cation transport ATPase